ncbi:hypothetical protein [Lysinibacillus fusiformis]|uniref:hypothetical protein n=1 Tax=Lysinibacillus fusiformis TaxID=28031 RepID=UPI000D33C433|nr:MULTISPECIES: hypothetical protein [Lysinibacillus]MED4668160.1 hypothetical protein [Lysinibacillus fusiformis]QAS58559.1 hypothetical protein LSP_20660 [Lysinibacillus sphaericus]RDV35443.1 hypothetical protein C7B90_02455 [Lysinibacillus fusiformis]GED63918.1 hypothetical protein LFU01_23700 [Lysinibacillus fusiformis]
MKRRAIIFKNIRIQKMAEFLTLLGLSIVFALVSAKLCIENNIIISEIFNYFSAGEMTIFIGALVMLIEGIYIFSKPEIVSFSSLKIVRFFLPYAIIFTIILEFHKFINSGGQLNELNNYTLVLLFTIFWIPTLYEFTKLIRAFKNILKNNVQESKDRLSIIITIVGTIISAIALIK